MGFIHVKDKETGHEYVVREHLFNPDAHTKTGKSALDAHGDPVPIKFKTTVTKAAAKKAGTGQANTPKETD